VVDFSAHPGHTLTMRNTAFTPFPLGVPPSPSAAEVLQLRVDLPLDRGSAPPVSLATRLRPAPFSGRNVTVSPGPHWS
jgi:hypothetical protein